MRTSIFVACFLLSTITFSFAQGQFKIRNDQYIQIGYTGYKALTFGQSTGTPNNGNFALEYCSGCTPTGLNIWKPYPTSGYANYLLFIRDNGNIGVGNQGDATYKMWINGSLKVVSVFQTSDLRFKENIKPLSNNLDKLMAIKTYEYKYIQAERKAGDSLSVNVNKEPVIDYNFDSNLHFGMIAQDIQKLYPNLVTVDEQGYLSLNYTEFIPLLIEAIQEQNKKILQLEKEILELKK